MPHYQHPFFAEAEPRLYAHRGGNEGGPENSLSAFDAAVTLGYHYLETDVVATLDRQLVAIHAVRSDRQSAKTGLPTIDFMERHTLDEARKILGKDEDTLPLFEELITTYPEAYINVDPKHFKAVLPLARLISTHTVERFNVGSFSNDRTNLVRYLVDQDCGRGALSTSVAVSGAIGAHLPHDWAVRYLRANNPHANAVQTWHGSVTRRVRDAVGEAGLALDVWTVNNPDRMRELLHMGIGGIMTDQVTTLKQVTKAES